jgi:hypothetical protein
MESNPNEPHQSTSSTKKSILIKPENEFDLNDFIQITSFPAGKKTREALARLSQKYGFAERDYKRGRLEITLDFAAFQNQDESQSQNKAKAQEETAKA